MKGRRFYFVEPSKAGNQHLTLLEGYLTALASSVVIASHFELVLCVAKTTLANLPYALISRFRCSPIPVMDPEKRRLIRKTLLEFLVVFLRMLKLNRGDILFITCVLPTTLWLLEFANRLLRRSGVYVVLHGEIEGLFSKSSEGFKRIGYWAMRWINSRAAESRISLVVLDEFIRDRLVDAYPEKLNCTNIWVVHHPVLPVCSNARDEASSLVACFIGYRTRFKSFDDFRRVAFENPSLKFLAIGGGMVEDIISGAKTSLIDKNAYLRAIARCSVAVFPYTSRYSCSLSAAALDALSTGVHIVALDRPFFRSLASYFGPDVVTVCSSIDELSTQLDCEMLSRRGSGRACRLKRLATSKYSLSAVQSSFEKLVLRYVNMA